MHEKWKSTTLRDSQFNANANIQLYKNFTLEPDYHKELSKVNAFKTRYNCQI